jgi:hypothetical protein
VPWRKQPVGFLVCGRQASLETRDWLARARSLGPSGLVVAPLPQSLSPLPKRLKSAGLEACATRGRFAFFRLLATERVGNVGFGTEDSTAGKIEGAEGAAGSPLPVFARLLGSAVVKGTMADKGAPCGIRRKNRQKVAKDGLCSLLQLIAASR